MEISLGLPVELHNLPPEMEVVQAPVERVEVRLSGPRRVVSHLSQLGINVPLDLTGAAEGETTFELFTSDIKVPERVTVTRVSPSSITLSLERTEKKIVGIRLPVEGKPAEGYRAEAVQITPGTMEIKGPRSHLKDITTVRTLPVNIDGMTEAVKRETTVILPEDLGIHALNRSSVQYVIPILPLESTGKGKP